MCGFKPGRFCYYFVISVASKVENASLCQTFKLKSFKAPTFLNPGDQIWCHWDGVVTA